MTKTVSVFSGWANLFTVRRVHHTRGSADASKGQHASADLHRPSFSLLNTTGRSTATYQRHARCGMVEGKKSSHWRQALAGHSLTHSLKHTHTHTHTPRAHTHTHSLTYSLTHTQPHTHTQTHTHARTHTHTHIHIHTHARTHAHTDTHTHITARTRARIVYILLCERKE
jgi:hypothetical protein